MEVLVTGATGQLGRELVPRLVERGDHPRLIVRDVDRAGELFPDCDLIQGDVVQHGLGIGQPMKLDAVYHLAADINLGSKHDERVWTTNYEGTVNVVKFCERNSVPHFFYAGTAYTGKGRNAYERSKKAAEQFVESSKIQRKTIFKIAILVPGLNDAASASTGALYQFVNGICLVLDRAEVVRRRLEGTLQPPAVLPEFRVKGNGDARLNLVTVDVVADFVVKTTRPGKFWLTHPSPPKLSDLAKWAGEALYISVQFAPDFEMSAVEALFHEAAAPFLPYLQGDELPSDLKDCPDITPEFITESAAHSIINVGDTFASKWLKSFTTQ